MPRTPASTGEAFQALTKTGRRRLHGQASEMRPVAMATPARAPSASPPISVAIMAPASAPWLKRGGLAPSLGRPAAGCLTDDEVVAEADAVPGEVWLADAELHVEAGGVSVGLGVSLPVTPGLCVSVGVTAPPGLLVGETEAVALCRAVAEALCVTLAVTRAGEPVDVSVFVRVCVGVLECVPLDVPLGVPLAVRVPVAEAETLRSAGSSVMLGITKQAVADGRVPARTFCPASSPYARAPVASAVAPAICRTSWTLKFCVCGGAWY